MTASSAGWVGRADVEAVLGFLADTQQIGFDQAYPPELMARLGALVPASHVVYRENDLHGRRTPRMVDAQGTYLDEDDELYWTVGPCAVTQYRRRTGDLASARLSDVVAWRQYRETAIYREYFRPGGVDHMLDLGLQATAGRQRTLLFCRERGEPDFTERERAILELLRPHLRAREARADLYRRAMAATADGPDDGSEGSSALTTREREVVFLAASGKTNTEIAAELWVTPGTVKKHLENVYLKLGVGSRAAAVAFLRRTAAG